MTEFSRKAQLLCWMAYLIALPASWAWLPGMVGEVGKQMAKGSYIVIMLVTALPLPWVMGGGLLKWLRRHPGLLNLPHKGYWLAPERADAAWARLDSLLLRLGWMIWCLLALIHYHAAAERPGGQGGLPALPETAFESVMFALVIAVLVDALHSTLAWRVPKATLEAFRAQQTHDRAASEGRRSIRRPPRPSHLPRGPGHGEPR
jgi:hypothetical protein